MLIKSTKTSYHHLHSEHSLPACHKSPTTKSITDNHSKAANWIIQQERKEVIS